LSSRKQISGRPSSVKRWDAVTEVVDARGTAAHFV
jgi:hypothetical protein